MKKHLLNAMLVGAMVSMGSVAQAQTTTLLEYGTADAAWTADAVAEWTAGGNPTIVGDYLELTGGNGSYDATKTLAPAANSIVKVQAVWRGRSNTGRAFSAGNGSYFRFGNIYVAQNDQDRKHGYGFDGLNNINSATTFTAGNYRVDITECTWLLIEAEINTASNTLTSFTIKSENGATTYVEKSGITLSNPDYTTLSFGYKKSGSVSTENKEDLKWVKITQTAQTIETADYTVKYVCDGVEVKEAASRTGVAGEAIALNADDTASIYANDKKYIFVSSDVEGKTVSEGEVVTVTFREAETWNYTVNCVAGETVLLTKTGTVFEGDGAIVAYPKYLAADGQLYTKDRGLSTQNEFNYKFTPAANNEAKTIEYDAVEGVNSVVFCAEGENIEGMVPCTSGNAGIRSSNSAAGYAPYDVTVTTLPAGKYNMYVSLLDATSAHQSSWVIMKGAEAIKTIACTGINFTEYPDNAFAIGKETAIIIAKGGNGNQGIDALYIVKTGDVTEEEAAELNAAAEAAEAAATTYAVVGGVKDTENAGIFSGRWDAANTTDFMTLNEETGLYTWTVKGATLEAQTIELKVIKKASKNSSEAAAWYPTNNVEIVIAEAGNYDISVTFDANADDLTAQSTVVATATENATYTLAGNIAAIFGTEWDVENADNELVLGEDGVYTKVYEGVQLDACTIEYKVVKNHSWDVNWGFAKNGNNADYKVNEAGKYNIYFYFVPEGTLSQNGLSVYCDVVNATTDGIAAVKGAARQGVVFNVAGQRVVNAQKGLFIVNGKKVVR